MTELGFQRNISQNPAVPGSTSQYFYTKENITVHEVSAVQTVHFQYLNILNISKPYGEVADILSRLKISPNSTNLMTLDCQTMAHDVGDPQSNLTSLISSHSKKRIERCFNTRPSIFSIVLRSQSSRDEDLQIKIEPLASSPTDSFFIYLAYKTRLHDRFDAFIKDFNEDKIKEIAESVRSDDKPAGI